MVVNRQQVLLKTSISFPSCNSGWTYLCVFYQFRGIYSRNICQITKKLLVTFDNAGKNKQQFFYLKIPKYVQAAALDGDFSVFFYQFKGNNFINTGEMQKKKVQQIL